LYVVVNLCNIFIYVVIVAQILFDDNIGRGWFSTSILAQLTSASMTACRLVIYWYFSI